MKYKIIIIGVVCVFIYSCDNRKDFYKDFNNAPTLQINSVDNIGSNHLIFTDNIVDSFKLSQGTYVLNLLSSDESQGSVVTAFINPSSNMTINLNTPIINGEREEITGKILFNPVVSGAYIINIQAEDIFKDFSNATAKIEVFNNKPPIILGLIITPDPLLNQYEYNFDASNSFDLDARYGGIIIKYNWLVDNNYNVETEFNTIQYIFPSSGTYLVKVRCQDNDGAWSPFMSDIVVVN